LLQVNAYYTNCNRAALCNCGLAVRSGNNLFVANFCNTTYKSAPRYNNYIVQRLRDDQNLVVTESGNTITVRIYNKLIHGTKKIYSKLIHAKKNIYNKLIHGTNL
jgi:hypothetical protein